jgi:hypothetical protein
VFEVSVNLKPSFDTFETQPSFDTFKGSVRSARELNVRLLHPSGHAESRHSQMFPNRFLDADAVHNDTGLVKGR